MKEEDDKAVVPSPKASEFASVDIDAKAGSTVDRVAVPEGKAVIRASDESKVAGISVGRDRPADTSTPSQKTASGEDRAANKKLAVKLLVAIIAAAAVVAASYVASKKSEAPAISPVPSPSLPH